MSIINRVEVYFDQQKEMDVVFRNAWMPNYQVRKINNDYFLANPAGCWILVDEEEFRYLQTVSLPVGLYKKLERKHIILTRNNTITYFDTYEKWTTPHFRHPVHHIIVSTLRCNLNCLYCHADIVPTNAGKAFDLSIETAKRILRFALNSKAKVQSFEFQGGESLLNKDILYYLIPEIRQAYKNLNKHVFLHVQTNATLLNDKWITFFEENQVRVGTSLDGPKQVHNEQRISQGGKGTYDVIQNKVNAYRLGTLPTVTKVSKPFWKEIISKQLEKGNTVISFHNVYPINSAKKNWDKIGLESNEYLEIYQKVCDHLKSLWTENYYPLERRVYLAFVKLITGTDVDFADFGNPCGIVHSQIAYNTNGDVYTCDEGRDFPEFRLGNVHTDTYDEIVFGSQMQKLKSLSIPNDPPCQTCAYRVFCSSCPVYERAVNGELIAIHAGTHNCHFTILIFGMILLWRTEEPALFDKIANFYKLTVA